MAHVLEPAGYRLVPDTTPARAEKDIESDLGDVYMAAAALHARVRAALDPSSDGGAGISPREMVELERLADEMDRQSADVRAHLEARKQRRKVVPLGANAA